MFGPDLLVAPVMDAGVTEREVYLPEGSVWKDAYTGKEYEGGQAVTVPSPLDIIPVMIRDGAEPRKAPFFRRIPCLKRKNML